MKKAAPISSFVSAFNLRLNTELRLLQTLLPKATAGEIQRELERLAQASAAGKDTPKWLRDLNATLGLVHSYDEQLLKAARNRLNNNGNVANKAWEAAEKETAGLHAANEELKSRIFELEDDLRRTHQENLAKGNSHANRYPVPISDLRYMTLRNFLVI